MGVIICQFLAILGITGIIAIVAELSYGLHGRYHISVLAFTGITEVVRQQHWLDRHIACMGINHMLVFSHLGHYQCRMSTA